MKEIRLQTSSPYTLYLAKDLDKTTLQSYLKPYQSSTIFIVTDNKVASLYKDKLTSYLKDYQVQWHSLPYNETKQDLVSMEEYKTIDSILSIYQFLAEHKAHRKSLLIAFGGGVIGDLTGFAAATYMRGIDYLQIPTTLLSQVDSSIGGKTGFNFANGKNNIGAFKQPIATFIATTFLQSLDAKQWLYGYSELLKHAFIAKPSLFHLLQNFSLATLQKDEDTLLDALYESCSVKATIVMQDEKESSVRALLNFGHTLGHLLEEHSDYAIAHGLSVLWGMDFALFFSYTQKYLNEADYQLLHSYLQPFLSANPIKEYTAQMNNKETFAHLLEKDKKNTASGLTFIVLNQLGKASLLHNVSLDLLWQTWQKYVATIA